MKAIEWNPIWKRKEKHRPRMRFCGSYPILVVLTVLFVPVGVLYWASSRGVVQ